MPAGTLVIGHTYALSITTTTTTRTARVGALGHLDTRYDNVSLALSDTAVGDGLQPIGDGASGSTGVTVRTPPLSDAAWRIVVRSFNAFAEVGKGPGGSVVDIARCTIVGTRGQRQDQGHQGQRRDLRTRRQGPHRRRPRQ